MVLRSGPSRGVVVALVAAHASIACCVSAQVVWRSGEVFDARANRSSVDTHRGLATPARPSTGHVVLQLAGAVDEALRSQLQSTGITLLSPLGNDAFFARVHDPAVEGLDAVVGWASVSPSWKIHPMLTDRLRNDVAGGVKTELVPNKGVASPVIPMYVRLFDDVERDAGIEASIRASGATIESWVASIPVVVVTGPSSAINRLAALDVVQWIEPALPAMGTSNSQSRVRTGAETAQASPYNLRGAGVRVLVYDGGRVLGSHADLIGRVEYIDDASTAVTHATHVAGTIAGSGAASSGRYRGMAPEATILSGSLTIAGAPGWLYTNPSDLEADYSRAVESGLVLANNSIGTNVASNGFDCAWYGDYGSVSSLIDSIIRGDAAATSNTPIPMIWSAGNERGSSRCIIAQNSAYHTVAPPASAKNAIVVGAINANNDTMTAFSSWGPTDDGRIKPDLVGPGCQSDGEFGITSCSVIGETAYETFCGTSMAAPAVTGVAALLIEQYRRSISATHSVRSSTLKALLVQTAADVGPLGPDYMFGYGSVRALPAIELLQSGPGRSLVEASATQGSGDRWAIEVPASSGPMRLTLAWDDAPAVANTGTTLINDLDLVLLDPQGRRFFPWKLNPAKPEALATRVTVDRVNNVEQIDVDSPLPGRWTVQIRGYRVPVGPQPFSLVSSRAMVPLGPASWFDVVAASAPSLNDAPVAGGTGNGNSFIDPGEKGIALGLEVVNNGVSLRGVTAQLFSLDQNVRARPVTISYPDLPTGVPKAGLQPFVFDAGVGLGCGRAIDFRVDLEFESSGDDANAPGPGGSASYNFTLRSGSTPGFGPAVATRFEGPSVSIPDALPSGMPGQPVDIPIIVSGVATIAKLAVRFDGSSCSSLAGSASVGLSHTYLGDLRLTLISPSETSVVILDRVGGTGNNLCGTVLDDDATGVIAQAADAPFTGVYKPSNPLSKFIGENPDGQWILRVQDFSPRDAGSVRAFSLLMSNFQEAQCAPPICPCSADFDRSDGTPDIVDIVEFVDAWLRGDLSADADCSGGAPDTTDINAFFDSWLAGGCS